MATLVLGAVGSAVGGPVGAAVGSILGGIGDRLLFGARGRREGARLSDLAVQGSSYGEGLPRLYGTMRVAGQVIWSTGLVETAKTSGGGKRSGGRTTTYSYAASFAVALAGRRIAGVGRVWADGKLLRNSGGEMLTPGVMRLHLGGEGQAADPLIAAAEGVGGAPAYRGIAYAVFEDLQLGDYANRVPNLSFEVIADEDPPSVGAIVRDLCVGVGIEAPAGDVEELVPGFAVGRGTSVRGAVEALSALAPVRVRDDGAGLRFGGEDAGALPAEAFAGAARREMRAAADGLPGEVSLGFLDIERDYQPGLQRARRTGGGKQEARVLAVAMTAGEAKRAAERLLGEAWARRVSGEAWLGWRHAAVQPGDWLSEDDGSRWRVRGWTMEGLGVSLELEREGGATRASLPASDGGRAIGQVDASQGETVLHVLDLPPLPGQPLPVTPRLWLAAAGTGAGWRRAEVLASVDGGASYESVAVVGPAVIGATLGGLPEGPCERWDRLGSVEVELLNDAMWLESRSEPSVLAGANLALVGDEIVAFAGVTATGARTFRLHGLLRGRRGTEAAVAGHAAGERFVLLSPEGLTPFDAPAGAIGGAMLFKGVGANELASAVTAQGVMVRGRALRPLSPVRLRAVRAGSDIALSWTRRSRQGFDWLDGGDAPLAEERERYVLRVQPSGGAERLVEVDAPAFTYDAAMQSADAGGAVSALAFNVAQTSALVGAGDTAAASFALP